MEIEEFSKCSNSEGYLDVEHVCLPFEFLLEKTPANERNIMDSACAYTTIPLVIGSQNMKKMQKVIEELSGQNP